MAGEKTEKATPKRRREERRKGNIFFSREIVTVISMITAFYSLQLLGPSMMNSFMQSINRFFELSASNDLLSISDMGTLFSEIFTIIATAALPMLIIGVMVSVIITFMQTRMLFSMKAASFKIGRLNPLKGLKRMVSIRSVVELTKSLIKISILAYIIYQSLITEIMELPRMMDMTVMQAISYTGSIVITIAQTVAIIMAFIAAFDYIYQWWEYEKNLKMSKQELKEEYKQTEGDPQVKGKIKERQQAMARQRMMQQVPEADVIIRNPTHFAIAIRYHHKKDLAPIVIAKGADHIALRIIEIAEQHDIVITENKPLARSLYKEVDLERVIPEHFYRPVAEVLAFVYSLKKKDLDLHENI